MALLHFCNSSMDLNLKQEMVLILVVHWRTQEKTWRQKKKWLHETLLSQHLNNEWFLKVEFEWRLQGDKSKSLYRKKKKQLRWNHSEASVTFDWCWKMVAGGYCHDVDMDFPLSRRDRGSQTCQNVLSSGSWENHVTRIIGAYCHQIHKLSKQEKDSFWEWSHRISGTTQVNRGNHPKSIIITKRTDISAV